MNNRTLIIKRVLIALGVIVLCVVGVMVGIALKVVGTKDAGHTGVVANGSGSTAPETSAPAEMLQIFAHPMDGFPGQDRVNILCMGIDDNWTDSDQVYTRQARTDTLFILSLDLVNKKVAMLSIPRDTYTHIAGTHWNFKINAAYQTGGPQRAIDTVQELLGVHADHYMVLNIDSTKKMVDALGGVDVNVAHEMHYHDKWGHLNIDLMPGLQHLNGDQAVGYARYRHPDAGAKASPEDGDERRMERQHFLMRAMIANAKNYANVFQAPHLMDVAMSTVRTDLTRTQLLDLAAIYRGMQPGDIQTASLPGDDFHGDKGAWFYRLDMDKAKAYVGWLVNGDENAARGLAPVVVKNGTDVAGLANHVVMRLRQLGYTDVRSGGNASRRSRSQDDQTKSTAAQSQPAAVPTQILDTGVPDTNSAQDIATSLNLTSPTILRQPNKPNHLGWVAPATITVTLGQDYADLVKSTGEMDKDSPATSDATDRNTGQPPIN